MTRPDLTRIGLLHLIVLARTLLEQEELARIASEIDRNILEIDRLDKELAVGVAKREEIDLNIRELDQISRVTEKRLNRAVSRTTTQDLLNANQEANLMKVSKLPKSENETLAEMVSIDMNVPVTMTGIFRFCRNSFQTTFQLSVRHVTRKCPLSRINFLYSTVPLFYAICDVIAVY